MIVALGGKGGAGKTTIAATMIRLLARSGQRVLAIDADSNPNLADALGLGERAATMDWPPTDLVSRELTGPALVLPIAEVLERYAVAGPDGARLLLMGMPQHAGRGCLCGGHATVRALLADLSGERDFVVVVDMEASPEHLARGTARNADVLLLVTEPYFRSLESVRRQAELAAELPIGRVRVLANKVRSAADREVIEEFCGRHGLALLGMIPWSDAVTAADARAVPLVDAVDLDGAAPVIEAMNSIAEQIVASASMRGSA